MVKHVDSTTTQILNNISRDVKRYGYQTVKDKILTPSVKDTIKTFITNNTHTVTKDCLLLATDADNVLCDKLLKLFKLNDRDLYAEYFLRFVISSRTDCYDMISEDMYEFIGDNVIKFYILQEYMAQDNVSRVTFNQFYEYMIKNSTYYDAIGSTLCKNIRLAEKRCADYFESVIGLIYVKEYWSWTTPNYKKVFDVLTNMPVIRTAYTNYRMSNCFEKVKSIGISDLPIILYNVVDIVNELEKYNIVIHETYYDIDKVMILTGVHSLSDINPYVGKKILFQVEFKGNKNLTHNLYRILNNNKIVKINTPIPLYIDNIADIHDINNIINIFKLTSNNGEEFEGVYADLILFHYKFANSIPDYHIQLRDKLISDKIITLDPFVTSQLQQQPKKIQPVLKIKPTLINIDRQYSNEFKNTIKSIFGCMTMYSPTNSVKDVLNVLTQHDIHFSNKGIIKNGIIVLYPIDVKTFISGLITVGIVKIECNDNIMTFRNDIFPKWDMTTNPSVYLSKYINEPNRRAIFCMRTKLHYILQGMPIIDFNAKFDVIKNYIYINTSIYVEINAYNIILWVYDKPYLYIYGLDQEISVILVCAILATISH